MPSVSVQPVSLAFEGGMDMVTSPGRAAPGTARFCFNYEVELEGGYRRVGGFERFSGQPRPHLAAYSALEAAGGFTGLAVGNTLTGATSGATGRVVYLQGNLVGVARVTGAFVAEVVRVGASPVGTITETQPAIDGFVDNELSHAAANDLRADIARVPGTGPVRGVAVLNSVVYAWRDSAGGLATYKATPTGWVLVPLFWSLTFNGGSVAYTDGSIVTRGSASATVKRVVLESGSWQAGTAAGRLVIEPISGAFTAGISGGGGVANLTGAAAQITMFSGGRVRTDVHSFTGGAKRLYCCDGVNLEWEFDGEVLVPINTGMGGIRASAVKCHKNHLFFAYRSSLQHSGTGLPYQWSPVVGAAELSAGDEVTNLVPVSGSESSAALMALCADRVSVLYGSSIDDWDLKSISVEAGAQRYSAQEFGGIVAFDRDGARSFRPTQSFGNFSYELATARVTPLVRGLVVKDSVLVKSRSLMRTFFADGLFLSAAPTKGGVQWMACDYGRVIECCDAGEIDGDHRVFMGDSDGWVLEADVGRSFDGDVVRASLRMNSLNMRSPMTEKFFRRVELDTEAEGACSVAMAAEFSDSDPDAAAVTTSAMANFKKQYGAGLFWDFGQWDRTYWDVNQVNRLTYPVHGKGRSISLLFQTESASELPHTLKGGILTYTPRRLGR
jgi:hypothetical protein